MKKKYKPTHPHAHTMHWTWDIIAGRQSTDKMFHNLYALAIKYAQTHAQLRFCGHGKNMNK